MGSNALPAVNGWPEAPPSAAGRPLKRPESQTPFPTPRDELSVVVLEVGMTAADAVTPIRTPNASEGSPAELVGHATEENMVMLPKLAIALSVIPLTGIVLRLVYC